MSELLRAELGGVPLVLLIALVFPGFVALRTYALFAPVSDKGVKDYVIEVSAYGLINFAIAYVPLTAALTRGWSGWADWLVLILAFIVLPALIAIVFRWILGWLHRKNWILSPNVTPWDDFFLRDEPCYIIVHLKDGRRIGGMFGDESKASLHPQPGHLYIQQLWHLNDDGTFSEAVPGSKGILIGPDEYAFIEMIEGDGHG